MRNLEERLTNHQLSSAKVISTLQKEIISQSQKYNEKAELMGTIARMEALLNPWQIAACQPEPIKIQGPPTIVEMANDISDNSSVSVMTGESVVQTAANDSLATRSLEQVTATLQEVTTLVAPIAELWVPQASHHSRFHTT